MVLGIPQHIQQKILESFFTTYSQQGATGLGLSVCYDIVRSCRGDVAEESKENEFPAFVVFIPV